MIFHFVSLDINYSFYIAISSYRQIVIDSFLYDNDKYLIIILYFLIIIYMYVRTYNQLSHMGLFLVYTYVWIASLCFTRYVRCLILCAYVRIALSYFTPYVRFLVSFYRFTSIQSCALQYYVY